MPLQARQRGVPAEPIGCSWGQARPPDKRLNFGSVTFQWCCSIPMPDPLAGQRGGRARRGLGRKLWRGAALAGSRLVALLDSRIAVPRSVREQSRCRAQECKAFWHAVALQSRVGPKRAGWSRNKTWQRQGGQWASAQGNAREGSSRTSAQRAQGSPEEGGDLLVREGGQLGGQLGIPEGIEHPNAGSRAAMGHDWRMGELCLSEQLQRGSLGHALQL
jgi:hypothetical protein